MAVQMEAEMCAIREMPIVSLLSTVPASGVRGAGFRVTLKCQGCKAHGSCGKPESQVAPVQLTRERTTLLDCWRLLREKIEDGHEKCVAAVAAAQAEADAQASATGAHPDECNAMIQLAAATKRAEIMIANKASLEAEQTKDDAEQEVGRLR